MPHPNSLLTDASIDALVKIHELVAPEPGRVRDRDIIETALVEYAARLVVERELQARLDALERSND